MTDNKTIFVTGGTGNQGGAVARNLADQGFKIIALTRNPASSKGQNLKNLNIQVAKGDLNNANTFREYLKDVYGIFSVQTFENGVEKEINQGITLATLAKEFGIKHFLYSSVFGAQLNTGVPHIESKLKIENHIKQIGLPFTIIRPTSLFENFLIPQVKKGILKGKLVQPIHRITRLFLGKNLYKMFKWMDEKSFFQKEDLDLTKTEFPNLLSLESWIEKNF